MLSPVDCGYCCSVKKLYCLAMIMSIRTIIAGFVNSARMTNSLIAIRVNSSRAD